jgi:NADH:ubiquinone oxidoreductase subunit 4 (subunit M)
MIPVISALSSLAASSLLLWVFHQAFITNTKPQPLEIAPGNLKEVALVLLLLLSLATLGFHPEPWLRLLDQPSTQIGKPYTKPDTSPTSIGLE